MTYRAYRAVMLFLLTATVFWALSFLTTMSVPGATVPLQRSTIAVHAATAEASLVGASSGPEYVDVVVNGYELANAVDIYCNIDWERHNVSCHQGTFYQVEVVQ